MSDTAIAAQNEHAHLIATTGFSAHMAATITGSLTVTLRPLRLALVVPPGNRKSIAEAIRINSYLWGGQYNPIIPLFKKLPAWVGEVSRPTNAKHFFNSYLDLFDPDFVIRLGSTKESAIDLGNRIEIDADEMLQSIDKCGAPSYGFGIFEILDHLLRTEFRFIRRDSLHMKIPQIGKDLFLASIFGSFPKTVPASDRETLKERMDYTEASCFRSNYFEFIESSNLFPRRICNHGIEPRRKSSHGDDFVFLMDADDLNDVLLYWNYRALGWRIFPVPIQHAGRLALLQQVASFVEGNYWPYQGNPSLYNHTTAIRSPRVTNDQLKRFVDSLRLKPCPPDAWGKISLRHWLPRFWDEWAREKDGAERCVAQASAENLSVRIEGGRFEFPPRLPDFAPEFGGSGHPRCANQLELKVYGDDHLYAQVIPAGGEKLARAAYSSGFSELRCSADGMVYFPSWGRWTMPMSAPSAAAIFTAWFQERGWQIAISDKGHIINQLLRQIGGSSRVDWLTEEPIFKLLTEIPKAGAMGANDLTRRLRETSKTGQFNQSDRLSKWLVESNIVKLGLHVKCPKCQQKSWYSMTEADYELTCRQCLETYRLPTETLKEMPWAYRGAGAFGSKVEVLLREPPGRDQVQSPDEEMSEHVKPTNAGWRGNVPDGLQGGLSVLLLHRLLASDMHPQITTLMSFNVSKGNQKSEVDLALFIRQMRYGTYQDDVVFAECKSYHGSKISRKDVERMEKFATQFPGAVVVFATLRRQLDPEEMRLLIPFAKRGRRMLSATRQRNPVIIFTGNELFSSQPPRWTWRSLGTPFSHFADEYGDDRVFVSLADATQQLYLGMSSMHSPATRRPRVKKFD